MLVATSVTWATARAGGFVAFGLLTVATLLGLVMSGRASLRRWPRFAVEDVHRYVGLLTGTFVGIHMAALLFDGFLPFSVTELLLPGTARYRPLPTGLGVVAVELLAALALTNHYRDRLSYRFWRRAHYLNFAVWTLALVHGIAAGSDSRSGWALLVYVLACATISGATVWRVLGDPRLTAGPRTTRNRPCRDGSRPARSREGFARRGTSAGPIRGPSPARSSAASAPSRAR